MKGIFHLAAVIEDAPVTALSEKSLKQTIESKALSAYYLHKTSVEEGLDLDHFMLFSSATVLWGNPDQAAYCAANSYLDSLAEERQSLGLPALSIQLGAVQGQYHTQFISIWNTFKSFKINSILNLSRINKSRR